MSSENIIAIGSLVISFMLALFGFFFKECVKKDAQGNVLTRFGIIPIPTPIGTLVVAFLTLFLCISVISTLIKESKDKKTREKLNDQIKTLQTEQAEGKEATLEQAAKVLKRVTRAQRNILLDLQTKHESYLDRFSSLLSSQQGTEKKAVEGFSRLLYPVTKDLTLALVMLAPAAIDTAEDADSDGLFRVNMPAKFLFVDVSIRNTAIHWAFKAARKPLGADIRGDLEVVTKLDLSTHIAREQAMTYPDERIVFSVSGISGDLLRSGTGTTTSWLDLFDCDYEALLDFEEGANFQGFQLLGIVLSSPALVPVEIGRFEPAGNGPEGYRFISTAKARRKWLNQQHRHNGPGKRKGSLTSTKDNP